MFTSRPPDTGTYRHEKVPLASIAVEVVIVTEQSPLSETTVTVFFLSGKRIEMVSWVAAVLRVPTNGAPTMSIV